MLDTCVSAQCRSGLDILLRQAGGKIESRRGLPEKATTEGTPPRYAATSARTSRRRRHEQEKPEEQQAEEQEDREIQ